MLFPLFTLFLLPLLSIASPAPAPALTPNSNMAITLSNFHAYESPPDLNYANWTTFIVTDATEAHSFICTYTCSGPLWDGKTWHGCEQRKGEGVDMSFQFGMRFGDVRMKKGWFDDKGGYMMGFASQPTHWDDGQGGNVTAMGLGRYYLHLGDWGFDVDHMVMKEKREE